MTRRAALPVMRCDCGDHYVASWQDNGECGACRKAREIKASVRREREREYHLEWSAKRSEARQVAPL